ncbi:MAG TPA: VanZ family protein [Terracidiphilus sp.]|nr:VanZ family protein [Terracidiphilus sp.]
MSSKRRGFGFWISAWWPVAVGIAIIAAESTPAFGSDRTSHPLRWLVQLLFGQLSDETWDLLHHLLRKSGHFLGYGALGLVWLRAWRMTLPDARFFSHAGLALLGTALVASWDEWHQTFLPNRTGSLYDVLLDCCGAGAMIGMAWLYLRSFRHARSAC